MIQMRAEARQARREIQSLQKQVAMLEAQIVRTNKTSQASFAKGIPGLSRWGNQLQWAGRQLQYNFTLPIAIAGAAATKWALDIERAGVRIKKVYGEAGRDAVFYGKEIEALGRNFEALSNKFGVHQSEVLDIAAAWAAAGSSGVALAKSVDLTLQTMILGELDAAAATEALIAIQAQYNFSTKQLSKTIDTLNMIENQTGISMGGLIQGFQRAAGVARTAGIDVEHLGAMLAALVPASGSAANAGNALKTIISRLLSPTKEASEVMQLMGIHVKETAWQSLNGTQRLEAMAKAYDQLNGSQKIVVASTIASRWQINRFDVLMKDVNKDLGYYNKSLQSTQDANANFLQKQKELNYVLDSSPQRLKQIYVILQNVMADVIQPLIPIILRLGSGIASLARWFQNLSPQVQATTMGLLIFLAAIGPLARYIGSVANLFGLLTEALHFFARGMLKVGGLLKAVFLAPFRLIGLALTAMQGAFIATAGVIRMVFITAMWNIGTIIQRMLLPALGLIGRSMLALVMPGLLALRTAFAQTFMQMAGAVLTSAGMMGRSLVAIWGSMLTQLVVLTSMGLGRLWSLWFVMSTRIVDTVALMAVNIPRLFSAMYIAILAGGRRLFMALPLLFAGMASAIRVGVIALASNVARLGALMVVGFSRMIPIIVRVLLGPWGLAITAIFGLVYTFRDKIQAVFSGIAEWIGRSFGSVPKMFQPIIDFFNRMVQHIVDVFWKLPEGVRNALIAVIKIVQVAVMKVYELFSYLNPFARHSPSLVESVTAGMEEIKRQYASVGNVGAAFGQAARDLAQYKQLAMSLQSIEWKDTAAQIGKGLPGYLALFNSLLKDLSSLTAILNAQGAAVSRQQAVVDKWAKSLDAANAALDREQEALDTARDKLSALNSEYQAHQQALQDFASAPIQGMQEMNDLIFQNEIEQKKLRLAMMDWEAVNGSIDDVRSRLAAMQGDIETMRGKASDLRAAGAGSDILGPIEAQIAAMEQQRSALEKSVQDSPISQIQDQLDELQKAAERLQLEKDIKFDPMVHEIEKLANAQKELSYDEIVAGIKSEQAAMAALQPQIDAATASVNQHEAALKAAQTTRDAIAAQYDIEKAKLDVLKDQYDSTEGAIRDIEAALRDMGTAAEENIRKASEAADKARKGLTTPGAQNFAAATGAADFPEVGGISKVGREGGLADQAKQIDELTAQITKDVEDAFSKFDMFGPIKEWWNKAWKWVEDNIGSKVQPILDGIYSFFSNLGNPFQNVTWGENIKQVWDTIVQIGKDAWGAIESVFKLFAPDIQRIVDAIVGAGKKIWKEVGPELEKFKKPLSKVGEAFSNLWKLIKPVIAVIGVALVGAIKILVSVFSNVLGPILNFVIDIIKSVIKVFRGLLEFIIGVFTLDLGMALDGIKDIFGGLWDAVFAIFEGVGKTLWGIVKGIVDGIVEWWNWLVDILVGNSIIPDMINDIIDWFKKMPGMIWDAVKSVVKMLVDLAIDMWNSFTKASSDKWAEFVTWVKGRPKAVWDAIVDLKNKLFTIAGVAWDAFKAKASERWNNIITWIKGLPGSAYASILGIVAKLALAAYSAWESFRTKAVERWGVIRAWIAGLPQSAYNTMIAIKDKLWAAASAAFGAFRDKAKDIIDGKNGVMSWIAGIPGRIAKAFGSVGSAVTGAIKSSWNAAAQWLNKYGLANINKVTEKFGLHINSLPTFAGGGVIPGRVSARDNTIIAARTGEGVIVPELVNAMGGARGLKAMNDAARRGHLSSIQEMGIPGFANGGIIGTIEGWIQKGAGFALDKILAPFPAGIRAIIPKRPFIEDELVGNVEALRKAARQWGDKKEEGGNKRLAGTGWQYQVDALQRQFPGIVITSTTRPGSTTVSGNTSYHALGRAVDMAPDMKYFDWILANYGKTSKELIYSPANARQIKNGAPYMYTGAVRDMHFNHVHWAYDKGGILPPGMTLAQNRTGNGELVLTGADATRLFNVIAAMDRMMTKSGTGATPGAATVARMTGAVASLESKLAARARSAQETTRGGDNIGTQLNFYGDLSFPNVQNADDAEDFLKHLKGLGG